MQKGKFSSLSWREKCFILFVYLSFINKCCKMKWSVLTWSKWRKLFLSRIQIAEKKYAEQCMMLWDKGEVPVRRKLISASSSVSVRYSSFRLELITHWGICEMPSFVPEWNISSLLCSSGWKTHPMCQMQLALRYSFLNSLYVLYQTIMWIFFSLISVLGVF